MWWVVVTNKHVNCDSIKFANLWHNTLLRCKNITKYPFCQVVYYKFSTSYLAHRLSKV